MPSSHSSAFTETHHAHLHFTAQNQTGEDTSTLQVTGSGRGLECSVNSPGDLCGRQSNRSESWEESENSSLLECSRREAALLQFASPPHCWSLLELPLHFGAVGLNVKMPVKVSASYRQLKKS